MTKKSTNNMDAVAIFPIRYRKEEPGTAESRLEEYELRREQIEEMYHDMTPEVQLDLILMFANTAEMHLRLTPAGTPDAQWSDILSRTLRQVLMVMTHLRPQAPKPSIALEDPNLYWPNNDTTFN